MSNFKELRLGSSDYLRYFINIGYHPICNVILIISVIGMFLFYIYENPFAYFILLMYILLQVNAGIIFFKFFQIIINKLFSVNFTFKEKNTLFSDIDVFAVKMKSKKNNFKELFIIEYLFDSDKKFELSRELNLRYLQYSIFKNNKKSWVLINYILIYYLFISMLFLLSLIFFNDLYSLSEKFASFWYSILIIVFICSMLYVLLSLFSFSNKKILSIVTINNIKNINCTIFRRNIYNEFIKEEVDDNQLEKIITINSLNISKNQRFLMLSNIIIYFIGYLLFQILFEVIFNSGVIIRGVSIGS